MEIALIVIIGLIYIAYVVATLSSRSGRMDQTLAAISAKTEQVTEQLTLMKDLLESVEWRTLPEEERQKRLFDRLPALTLLDVQKMKAEMVVSFVTKSYYYPSDFPVFDQFQYKHGGIDDTKATDFGFKVNGSSRQTPSDEWKPYSFFAKLDECTTSSCSGIIRRG